MKTPSITRNIIILCTNEKEKSHPSNYDTPSILRHIPISEVLKCEKMWILESMKCSNSHFLKTLYRLHGFSMRLPDCKLCLSEGEPEGNVIRFKLQEDRSSGPASLSTVAWPLPSTLSVLPHPLSSAQANACTKAALHVLAPQDGRSAWAQVGVSTRRAGLLAVSALSSAGERAGRDFMARTQHTHPREEFSTTSGDSSRQRCL